MRLSQLFTRTSKESHADAASVNADLLTRAGFIHKTMAGTYSFLPLGLRVLRAIERIVREEMDRIGGQEVLLSALSPRESWEKTGRWDTAVFDALFHLPAADDQEYGLNPTHEEVITPLARTFVRSYRDLPFAAYQIQTKFRNELRAKSGLLRGREFLMKDLYSFHADEEDLERYYRIVMGAYERVFERLGLGDATYLTYASGGSFSQYSHEYQVLLPQGEDTIYLSVEAEKQGKRIAINKEIFEEGVTVCPVTGGAEFREETGCEAGNIFQLGTKFSEAFSLRFTDESGAVRTAVMGCYGIGISRLMGIIAEAFSDDRGLRWPASIAPADVHLVPIARSEENEAFRQALALSEQLEAAGKRVLLDDRLDASVGVKLADSDLIGVPARIIISPKTLEQQSVEYSERGKGEATLLSHDAAVSRLAGS